MESKLQKKLREHREKTALEGISRKLSGLFTGQGIESSAVPAWVRETTWGFWDISVEPIETLPDDVEPEAVDRWIEGLLTRHGLAGKVYVYSHLSGLPWLECQAPASGWVSRVRDAVEDPWMFLSGSLDVVVAVLEAEYRYEAHVGHRPPVEPAVDPKRG
ncbi:hypothetical protein [Kitasatospora sp. GP82]|uniref:hypothetical protein n=1 Tax=Kitasatospora sp. GP82 TaxID=3035089 RepID=UPI0024760925|nr:hypothetical protein [Kitasatospora sp. GP82]MDH6123660.1 hypothetical protein [Kitasatospora sp. GP82]